MEYGITTSAGLILKRPDRSLGDSELSVEKSRIQSGVGTQSCRSVEVIIDHIRICGSTKFLSLEMWTVTRIDMTYKRLLCGPGFYTEVVVRPSIWLTSRRRLRAAIQHIGQFAAPAVLRSTSTADAYGVGMMAHTRI